MGNKLPTLPLRWTNAGMTFWAISDLNQADIRTFAETYASAK